MLYPPSQQAGELRPWWNPGKRRKEQAVPPGVCSCRIAPGVGGVLGSHRTWTRPLPPRKRTEWPRGQCSHPQGTSLLEPAPAGGEDDEKKGLRGRRGFRKVLGRTGSHSTQQHCPPTRDLHRLRMECVLNQPLSRRVSYCPDPKDVRRCYVDTGPPAGRSRRC